MDTLDKFKEENPKDGKLLEMFSKSDPENFNFLHEDLEMSFDMISKSGKGGDIEGYPKEGKEKEGEDEYTEDQYKADCEASEALTSKMSKYKGKKEKSEAPNDILKSEGAMFFKAIKRENAELKLEQSEIKKSMETLLEKFSEVAENVKKIGDSEIVKSLPQGSLGILEKSGSVEGFVMDNETGTAVLSLSKQRDAVIGIIDGAIQKSEGADKEDLKTSIINFTAGGGGTPSQKTAEYLMKNHKVRLEA